VAVWQERSERVLLLGNWIPVNLLPRQNVWALPLALAAESLPFALKLE
jgi:hypothetical protein